VNRSAVRALTAANKRRHIGNVQEALDDVRGAVAQLVKKRDERRDSFASGSKTAMATPFGSDAEEVHKRLGKHGISSRLAEQVVQLVGEDRVVFGTYNGRLVSLARTKSV
jgi:hypothetical protein